MRLTTGEEPDIDPVWSPDGRRVAFASRRTDSMDVYVAPADGSREATLWFGAADANERPTQWKADPSVLIVWRGSPSGRAMEVVPVSSQTVRPPGEPITSIAGARLGRLSPDGRYLAYGSDRSGRAEVYVRTFPNGEHRIQVSVDGGRQPRWSPDGSELFYVQDDSLLAVRFTSSAVPAAGVPEKVFSRMGLATSVDVGFPGIAAYDVASDGSRFLVRERLPGTNAIRVVQNWFEEFRNER